MLLNNKTELLTHTKTQMSHKCTFLSEWNQTQKTIYCIIPFVYHSENGRDLGMDNRSMLSGWNKIRATGGF